ATAGRRRAGDLECGDARRTPKGWTTMDNNLRRAYLIELIGTFAVVYISAGVVCVNHLTTPSGQESGTSSLAGHQPGLVGIALAHGLILAAALAVTVPLSGGYLNP